MLFKIVSYYIPHVHPCQGLRFLFMNYASLVTLGASIDDLVTKLSIHLFQC
jgi:hypothetical protein